MLLFFSSSILFPASQLHHRKTSPTKTDAASTVAPSSSSKAPSRSARRPFSSHLPMEIIVRYHGNHWFNMKENISIITIIVAKYLNIQKNHQHSYMGNHWFNRSIICKWSISDPFFHSCVSLVEGRYLKMSECSWRCPKFANHLFRRENEVFISSVWSWGIMLDGQ